MAYLALLGLLVALQQAHATSFAQRPFPVAVEDAPNIVRGRVGTSYSDWGKLDDSSRRIFTFFELQVDEVMKAAPGSNLQGKHSLTMRELGGEKDGVGMEVPGNAHFERGEDVVIFLGMPNVDGSYDIRGMMMGKYSVKQDSDGKEYLAGPGLALNPSDDHDHEEKRGQDDTPPASKWTLDALRHLIATQAEHASSEAQKTPKPQQVSQLTAKPLPQPSVTLLPAPGLQPQASGTSAEASPRMWWLWIAGGVVIWFTAYRRRKQR